MKRQLYFIASLLLITSCAFSQNKSYKNANQKDWVRLFNGKNFDGWDIKITGEKLNANYKNTFRVEDGMMRVMYDQYESFNDKFGHIYYKKPYSYYVIRFEYRFQGDQLKGGASWNVRNSGIMLHSQSAKSLTHNQTFPVSLELQLLGGLGGNTTRHTGNLCTPGTEVYMQNKIVTDHCTDSDSRTYHGDQWVNAKFLVLGDSIIQHYANDEMVLSYQKPQFGGGTVNRHNPAEKRDGELIKGGYISLQSESHPIAFRKVRLYNLESYVSNPKKLAKKLQELGVANR